MPFGPSSGGGGTGGYIGYIVLQDQKAANTQGGQATSGSWTTRVLNTEVIDTNNNCTLAANQFTLTAGTYEIVASAPAFAVTGHKTRLQNVTGATTVLDGTSEWQDSANPFAVTRSWVFGRFTIAAGQALELQHQFAATRATNGLGIASNFAVTEIYASVTLYRVS